MHSVVRAILLWYALIMNGQWLRDFASLFNLFGGVSGPLGSHCWYDTVNGYLKRV